MNRFSLSAALVALSLILVFFALRIEDFVTQGNVDVSESIDVEGIQEQNALEISGVEDSPTKIVEIFDEQFAPQGRFSDYDVLDQRVDWVDAAIYKVLYLLRDEDPRMPVVFLEERYPVSYTHLTLPTNREV